MINYGLLNTTQQASPQQMMSMANMLKFGQDVSAARGRMELGKLMQQGTQDYNQLGATMTQAAGPVEGFNVFDPSQRAYKLALTERMQQKALAPAAGIKTTASDRSQAYNRMATSQTPEEWQANRASVVSGFPDLDSLIPADFTDANVRAMQSAGAKWDTAARLGYTGNADTRAETQLGLSQDAAGRDQERLDMAKTAEERKKEADEMELLNKQWTIAARLSDQVNSATEDAREGLAKIEQFNSTIGGPARALTGQEAAAVIRQFMLAMEPNSAVMQGEYDAVKGAAELLSSLKTRAGVSGSGDIDAKSQDPSWLAGLIVDKTSVQQMQKVLQGIDRVNRQAIAGKIDLGEKTAAYYKLPKSALLLFRARGQMSSEQTIPQLPEAGQGVPAVIPSKVGGTTFGEPIQ